MSEEVKKEQNEQEETLYCECCGCLIDDDDYTEWNGQIICSDCLETTPPPVNAVGNASGTRMSMAITTSPFAAIATIITTLDAAAVMLSYTRMMLTIWMAKHIAVTVTRMNERRAT